MKKKKKKQQKSCFTLNERSEFTLKNSLHEFLL